MGGILILSSFFLSTVLWGDVNNHFIWIVLLAGFLFGLIGYVDDKKKIKEQKSDGISSKNKFLSQFLSSFVLGILVALNFMKNELLVLFYSGFLGCFSTFSSFIYQLFVLFQERKFMRLFFHYFEVIIISFLCFYLGYFLMHIIK